ncbi:MAG TPA: SH3 domain-containing protein [Candidatus Acidoferrales bacterium]|nr:SH3 domain-containing protein [Candidatus Acidoferrales bacterium]
MSRWLRYLLPLAALWITPPVFASDIGAVKCGPNQDRVWVYDSLNSFDVATRLKCGEPVEILSRVKGYVKIRTESGQEGYVTDAAFPDLPALPDESNKPVASAAPRPAPTGTTSIVVVPPTLPAAPDVNAAPEVPAPAPPAQPAKAAAPAVIVQPTAAAPPAVSVPATRHHSSNAPVNEPPGVAKAMKQAASKSSAQSAAKVSSSASRGASSDRKAAPATGASNPAAPQPAAPVVPAKGSVSQVTFTLMDSPSAAPPRDISISQPVAAAADSEDYPDAKPENESADPACRVFFSVYGLSPAQYKWLVDNRRKQYASICPAPDLARVDYVILLAHDSDSYMSAMPTPVSTDHNGFSDFNPVTMVDSAIISTSELEKARYEFVWVFHTRRGTFDPTRFSARRRPQFTTDAKGSHASARAMEDAFHFIEGQGNPNR